MIALRFVAAIAMWFIAGFLLTLSLGGSTHLAGQLGLAGVIFVLLYFVLVILPSESNRIAFFVGVFEGQEGYNTTKKMIISTTIGKIRLNKN
jgi:hypothetical protein